MRLGHQKIKGQFIEIEEKRERNDTLINGVGISKIGKCLKNDLQKIYCVKKL